MDRIEYRLARDKRWDRETYFYYPLRDLHLLGSLRFGSLYSSVSLLRTGSPEDPSAVPPWACIPPIDRNCGKCFPRPTANCHSKGCPRSPDDR